MTPLVLAAPLAGWATRLDEVPDPAFAQGLVGDGVAIDPTSSELCAPCDGVVVSVHRARHACTLRADGGAEILLHIGIDTVALRGEGFRVLVADGQRVRIGDPLIRFDLDLIARRARSLHTLVILVGGDGLAVIERAVDREVTTGAFLLAIGDARSQGAPRDAQSRTASGDTRSRTAPNAARSQGAPGDARSLGAPSDARGSAETSGAAAATAVRHARLALPDGLHARPAAAFARRARQHAGTVTVACRDRSASGKSMAALMALDARRGDDLAIAVGGAGADAVASELAALVAAGPGEAAGPAPWGSGDPAGAAEPAAPGPMFGPGEEIVLEGAAAAAGLATGRAVRLADLTPGTGAAPARDGAGPVIEQARLARALAEVQGDLEQTIAGAEARGAGAAADIFRAHLELLADPELAGAAGRELAAGRSAAWAWRTALRELAAVLRGLGNPRLAERTGDLGDLERRTLARLAGTGDRMPAEIPEGAVLIADELAPSELAAAPPGRLVGLCTAHGGPTSHVAILAAGMGIPAVVAIGDAALRVPDGAPVIIDGDRGRVRVFPAAATCDAARTAIASRAQRRRAALAAAHQPARTADGVEIAVHANLASVGGAAAALGAGADGCGLLRTEFVFLDRASAPGEDEQAAAYQQIAGALQGRPVVIRTLDAGGDKPLPYLAQPREDNPALGVRGVRLALRHPALLRTQLRAILRVAPAGACRILVPMIATLAELRAVRALLEDERRALGVAPVPLGAMIEVPAAALAAAALAREAEFFSIGTNDLAQYALAMDRGNGEVAAGLDPLHPGVLGLVASTVRGAAAHGRPVAVCGGAAADRAAVPIFLGLGVRALSVAPALVPEIKALVRTLSLARCAELAAAALDLDDRDDVRALVAKAWPGPAAPHDRIDRIGDLPW